MEDQNIIKTARGERSRKNILDTASRLIGKFGSNNVTLDQVAKECKIAKSSILWHFGSKEELFLEIVDLVYQSFEKAMVKKYSAKTTRSEKVRLMLQDYAALLIDRPEIPYIFYSFAFNSKKQAKIKQKTDDILDWSRNSYMQHLGISQNLATILLGMVTGVVIQWILDPDQIEILAVLEEMIPIFNNLIDNEHSLKGG